MVTNAARRGAPVNERFMWNMAQLTDDQGGCKRLDLAGEGLKPARKAKNHLNGVAIGMSMAQVRKSPWGKLSKVDRTITAYGVSDQWLYAGGNLYFINGVLDTVQN